MKANRLITSRSQVFDHDHFMTANWGGTELVSGGQRRDLAKSCPSVLEGRTSATGVGMPTCVAADRTVLLLIFIWR
jgi:hypothetical protein